MVQSLAQSQYLDEYIFKVAEGISPHHGNLVVGTLESIAGVTKLLVAWTAWIGDLGVRPVSKIGCRDIVKKIIKVYKGNGTKIFQDEISHILVVSERSNESLF